MESESEGKMLQKITVMILPVGLNCNLSCRYCYHNGPPRNGYISEIIPSPLLKKTIKESRKLAVDVDFLWHGGEPLLAGLNFYRTAIDLQHSVMFRGRIRNILQTNGTLITDEWAKFIVKNQFLISVSLDGPEWMQNANRITPDGQGTFKTVVSSIKKLVALGRAVGAIAVITKTNVKQPDEVYDTLKSLGLRTCAVHVYAQNEFKFLDFLPDDKEAVNFFQRVFDLWLNDDNPDFLIRNFRNVIRVIFGGRPLDCASNYNHCRQFIAVTSNGDVYPCHRFVNRDRFKLGNISKETLCEIYEKSSLIYDEMANIHEECFLCQWFQACGGGCAYERFIANGSFSGKHPECSLKQQLFSHIAVRVQDKMQKIH